MENKEIKLIVKILLIIGVVFVGLSLLVPWLGTGFYLWGSSIFGQTSVFYIDFIGLLGGYGILLMLSSIITFALVMIALGVGIRSIINVDRYKPNTALTAGILSVVSMIVLAVILNIGYSILDGGFNFTGLNFGLGFYMMIIPTILFFAGYGIQITLLSKPTTPITQQPMYQQNVYQPQPAQPMQPSAPPMPATVKQPQPPPVQQTAPPPAQTSDKFCAECGAELQPNVKFCPECGAKL